MARQGKGVDLSESIKDLAEVSKPLKLSEYVTRDRSEVRVLVLGQSRPQTWWT